MKFHDGRVFTADDVVFSWERANTLGALALGKLDMIRGVTAVDERTVDIALKYPFPILPQTIANWFMMSRGRAEANEARASSNLSANQEGPAGRRANGTGPFMLALREPGIRTVLQRNPAWWD